MSVDRTCPDCGEAIPPHSKDGLCSQCLLSLGLKAGGSPPTAGQAPDLAPLLAKGTPSIGIKFHFFGDYELLEEIARGGMGIVFKARQMSLNRLVAVKLINAGTLPTEEIVKRFRAEAEAAAGLSHPNIVPIYEIGEHDGQNFFSMGLVEGGTLREAILEAKAGKLARSGEHRVLELQQTAKLVSTMARAVHHAHQRGVLHRDIKPSNILLDAKCEPFLTDFGLAKLIEKGTTLTCTNIVMGTPAYMSPEQARGNTKEVTTATDVYSLGAVLYEMLTGSPPFEGESSVDIIRKVLDQDPQPPSLANPEVDRDLETICLKCLEKEPERRYASAEAVAVDLDKWVRHEPIQARPITSAERVGKWVRRRPAVAALTTGLAVAFIVGLVGVSWQWRRAEDEKAVAQTQRDAAQHNLYIADMNLAQTAWERNNVKGLRKLLGETATYPERGFEWYYWQRQVHLNHKTLYGHLAPVFGVAFSPDGKRIISACEDSTARLWDVVTGQELLVLRGHAGPVRVVAFSPEGELVATAGDGPMVKLWEAASGKELFTLTQNTDVIRAVAFSPDGRRIAIGARDGIARVWDRDSRKELFSLKGHTDEVRCLAFSPNGLRIASASRDGTAKVWSAADGAELLSLGPHVEQVWSVAFSPNNDFIVTGDSRLVRLWSLKTGRQIFEQGGHGTTVYSVAFSPAGDTILSSSEDQTATLWDLSGKRIFTFKGHIRPVYSASFSPDGREIVTAGWDQTVRIWRNPEKEEPFVLRGHEQKINSVAFSLDNRRLVTSSDDGTARVWESSSGREVLLLKKHAGPVSSAAFSPNGQWVVTGSHDKTAKVWDAEAGRELISLIGHRRAVNSVAFSPDGRRVVTGSEDRTAKVWDAATGKELFSIQIDGVVHSVAFSPNGQRIVTGGQGGVRIWGAADGKKTLTIKTKEAAQSVAFLPDNHRILCGFRDWTTGVWDLFDGQEVSRLSGHNQEVWSVAFSPDGKRVLTGSIDQTVRIWETSSGRELFALTPEEGQAVTCVAFSPDGRRIAAGTWSKVVRIWQAASMAETEIWRDEERTGGGYVADQENAKSAIYNTVGGVEEELLPQTLRQNLRTAATTAKGSAPQPLGPSVLRLMEEGKYAEAEPLARQEVAEARVSGKKLDLSPPLTRLADILQRQGRYGESEALYREDWQLRRSMLPPTSDEVLSAAASLGRLLADKAWADLSHNEVRLQVHERALEAEKLLRECCQTRGRVLTNYWRFGDSQSRLGFAVVVAALSDATASREARLARLDEAQNLLLMGYETLLKDGPAHRRYLRDAIQRLVRLYQSWEKEAPNTGKAPKAAEWEAKLLEFDREKQKASDPALEAQKRGVSR